MIRRLVIHNLILVDSCELVFGSSFHVITGETGSGKTALTEAIRLCLGERVDSELIRKGCDKGSVEMHLSIEGIPGIKDRLEQAGLEADEEEIVIRRELSREGKNRAFINCKAVPLPLLQSLGEGLIDLIGQNSHQQLRSSDAQRRILDLFGDLDSEIQRFQESYREEKRWEKKVQELEQLCQDREKNEEIWRFQYQELDEAQLKEGEEEELLARYTQLSSFQDGVEKMSQMTSLLTEGSSALIPQLNRLIRLQESMLPIYPSLQEASPLLREALISLKEVMRTLESKIPEEAPSPDLLSHLEDRLSLIAKFKRKYASSFTEIEAIKSKLQEQLSHLSSLAEDLQESKAQLNAYQANTRHLADSLSLQRKDVAARFEVRLSQELQELNMKGASVRIHLLPTSLTLSGQDLVQFWLQANPGETPSLVKEQASGGEVSRLLFAIKIVLAEKNETPTLVFDEIDSNVGGKTATLLGNKLRSLGRCKQVICITHFPQVASQADIHFQVQKTELGGRTCTQIRCLTQDEMQQELIRMGGK